MKNEFIRNVKDKDIERWINEEIFFCSMMVILQQIFCTRTFYAN